jgi:hypothetical protein
MWHDLSVALALMFVIEGILPFANPGGFRRMLQTVAELDDKALHWGGLASMGLGVGLLYLVN